LAWDLAVGRRNVAGVWLEPPAPVILASVSHPLWIADLQIGTKLTAPKVPTTSQGWKPENPGPKVRGTLGKGCEVNLTNKEAIDPEVLGIIRNWILEVTKPESQEGD